MLKVWVPAPMCSMPELMKNQARLAELQAEFSRIEAVADIYLVLGEADKLFEVVHQ